MTVAPSMRSLAIATPDRMPAMTAVLSEGQAVALKGRATGYFGLYGGVIPCEPVSPHPSPCAAGAGRYGRPDAIAIDHVRGDEALLLGGEGCHTGILSINGLIERKSPVRDSCRRPLPAWAQIKPAGPLPTWPVRVSLLAVLDVCTVSVSESSGTDPSARCPPSPVRLRRVGARVASHPTTSAGP